MLWHLFWSVPNVNFVLHLKDEIFRSEHLCSSYTIIKKNAAFYDLDITLGHFAILGIFSLTQKHLCFVFFSQTMTIKIYSILYLIVQP